jgi:hypothetical protein
MIFYKDYRCLIELSSSRGIRPWDSSKVVTVTRSNLGVGNDIDAIL